MLLCHSEQAFRMEVRSGEQLWQKGSGDTHLPSAKEETLERSDLTLQIPILDQAFLGLY